jgi:hypothetical protein
VRSGRAPAGEPAATASLRPDAATTAASVPRRRSRRWALAALAGGAVLVGVAAWLPSLWRRTGDPGGPAAPAAPTIRGLRISHFGSVKGGIDPRGELGVRSFETRFGDKVRVDAELSEPGFAFLLALNPNGKVQLCLPDDERSPPERRGRLEYPTDAADGFTLDDGPGLQAFVLAAGRQPLPAYVDWERQVGVLGWKPTAAAAGVVWRGDERRLEPLARDDLRGTVKELAGLEPLREACRRLRAAPGVEAVAVVAFAVRPRSDE